MRAQAFGLVVMVAQGGLALPVMAQDAGQDLAPLLAGFERCHANAAFKAFEESVMKRYSNDFGAKVARDDSRIAIKVPAVLQGALGPARSTLKPDYTEVSVPLKGQFSGLAVRAVIFHFGNENGIGSRALAFEAPLAVVRERFAKGLAAAQKAQSTREVAVTFKVEADPAPAILCDFSN